MGFIIKRLDGMYLSADSGSAVLDWTNDCNQAQNYDSLAQALTQKDACKRAQYRVDVIDLDQPRKKTSEGDWRTEAFLILDRKFHESPHLNATINSAGDYEIHCSKCGTVGTFAPTGNPKVDAFTFALQFSGQHAHKA